MTQIRQRPVGLLAAMPEELATVLRQMNGTQQHAFGGRSYFAGQLWDVPAVVAFSRWGKVAAAITAVELIREFSVSQVVFTGVAGGIAPGLQIGDVVVGRNLFQHDMDARPIFPRFEIPLTGITAYQTNETTRATLLHAASEFLVGGCQEIALDVRSEFGLSSRRAQLADIASGDRFVADAATAQELREALPTVACVEMEGAAVAQVCSEYGVPFGIVRVVSDNAADNAHIDFARFVRSVAGAYALGILSRYFSLSLNPARRP